MTDTKEQEAAFKALQKHLRELQEQQERERTAQNDAFFRSIPKDAKSLCIHLSHKVRGNPYVKEIQIKYGSDNVLVTIAPAQSGQSFYNDSLDKIATEQKTKQVIEPFENFSKNKSIDAIIYLCNYICDGYQDPIFPDSVQTKWHIWRPIKLAEELKKPLIIGYQNDFCFSAECYEREYITGATKEKIKCETKIVRI